MFRHILFWSFLTSATALSAPADFSKGALELGLRYGLGFLSMDSSFGEATAVFPAEARGAPAASLSLGYNILGHASLTLDVTPTGWNLRDNERGGGGFVGGLASWHPLSLVWNDNSRPLPLDVQLGFGAAYALFGQRRVYDVLIASWEDNYALEGWAFQSAFEANYYFTSNLGLGLYLRGFLVNWDKRYSNLEKNIYVSFPEGRGAQFWTGGLRLTLRFET